MKACTYLQAVKHLDPTIMSAERCLEMATINGAKALGLEDEIGSIEPGKLADIAAFDLNTPRAVPANNPISALVFSSRGADARWVFVNGREVVTEGKLAFAPDLDNVLKRGSERALEIITKAGLVERTKPQWPSQNMSGRKH
jgi:5-methylthioadenosine/S-adenosylhomocysteine deaminase